MIKNYSSLDKQNFKKDANNIENLKGLATFSFESTTTPSRKSNELIDSSNECFEKFLNSGMKSSLSSFSIKNNLENDLNYGSCNSADNGANLYVPLLLARKNKIQNNSSKHLNCNNDLKTLSKTPSPLFLVPTNITSTTNSLISSMSDASKPITELTKKSETIETKCDKESEETDVLNEISKVENWLRDNNNNLQKNRNYKVETTVKNSLDVKLSSNDSAIDVQSNW